MAPAFSSPQKSDRHTPPANAAATNALPEPVEEVRVVSRQADRGQAFRTSDFPSTTDASNKVGKGVRSFARSLG